MMENTDNITDSIAFVKRGADKTNPPSPWAPT